MTHTPTPQTPPNVIPMGRVEPATPPDALVPRGGTPVPVLATGGLTFGEAMLACANGSSVRRREWPADVYCSIRGGLLHVYREGQHHQCVLGDGDILNSDWELTPQG